MKARTIRGKALHIVALGFLAGHAAFCQEADLLLPEDFSSPQPLLLRPEFERRAEGSARYLQSLFEEQSDGPDRALETECKVLALDPSFTSLAMEVAHQYLRQGATSEAIAVLKDAAKNSQGKPEPLVALAGIYLRQLQKPDLAEKFALQALAAAPDEAAPYQILFEIYKSGAQSQKTESLFSKAAKRNPPSAEFWLDLVDLRLRDPDRAAADYAKVVEMLDRATKFAGDKAEALVRIGDCFILCNQPGRAAPLYQLALTLHPGLEALREKLAACLLQVGDHAEAAKILESMVKDNPLNFRVYDQLAELYLLADAPSKALASLKQALLVAPPDPRRYSELVQLCLRTGDPGSAISFAEDAEKRFPQLLELTFFKALALSQAKRHEEALRAFERILVEGVNTNPSILNGDFYFSYGVSAEQAGHFSKAAEALKKSIELDPANAARSYNYMGFMWADRNENLEEAEAMIRKAVEMEPENGAYLDSLGWVYFKKGLYAQALHELLRAAELLKEDDAVVFDHIGDAYENLGKTADAVAFWQKAFQLDAENPLLAAKLEAHSAKVVRKPEPSQQSASP